MGLSQGKNMTMLRRFFSITALLALAACGGGGGGSGTPPFGGDTPGGGTGPTVSDLTVVLSSPTIPNTGTGTVVATITALNANRVALPGATVTVSANAGAVLTVQGTLGSVTDANGQIVANVGIGADQTNRDITVTAVANGITATAVLKVVNSTTGTIPTTIEIIAGETSIGTGGDGVTVRAFVKDANNNALPNVAVSFSSTTGTLSGFSTATNSAGTATATISAGADKSNRQAVITVSAGSVTNTLTLPITGTRLTLSGPSSLIRGTTTNFDVVATDSKNNVVSGVAITATSSLGNALAATAGTTTNASGQVRYSYTATTAGTDSLVFAGAGASVSPSPALVISGQTFAFVSPAPSATVPVNTPTPVRVRLEGVTPLAGNTIDFAATGGTLTAASANTDANGEATVSLTSSSAGPVTVQATVRGTATSTTLPLVIVATVPARLVLQVAPTAIAPNIGTSTTNQVQVFAKVTDASGNPVQGQIVNFSRVVDPSGGNLLQASATTDSSGQASVAYRPGSESTANNGVVLSAAIASQPSISGQASLTVNQTALFIALGTGNVITNTDTQTYRKDWVVYVTDSNGIAVNGATLTIKAIPTHYRTGELVFLAPDGPWVYKAPIWECRNEDANANGILDDEDANHNGVLDAGEDANGNGRLDTEDDNDDGVLWPGNVIAVSPGSVQTANGRATISLSYAESFAPWVRLRLTASATVAGTESSTSVEFVVSGSAEDFNSPADPAGKFSPFGLRPTSAALLAPGACSQ